MRDNSLAQASPDPGHHAFICREMHTSHVHAMTHCALCCSSQRRSAAHASPTRCAHVQEARIPTRPQDQPAPSLAEELKAILARKEEEERREAYEHWRRTGTAPPLAIEPELDALAARL